MAAPLSIASSGALDPEAGGLPADPQQLRAALARGLRHFPGLQLRDLDGVDLDLGGCDLRDALLAGTRLEQARLEGSRLPGSDGSGR